MLLYVRLCYKTGVKRENVMPYHYLLFACSFASGCMALPVLMNIKQVIEQRQCSGVWTHKDELPVSPFEFTFHQYLSVLFPNQSLC